MGKDLNSLHNNAQRAYIDLMNQAPHIEVSLDKKKLQQIAANRLRLKTSIDVKVEHVLKSSPQNASYTSSKIQKGIVQIYAAQATEITHLVSTKKLATRTRMNQIGTLQCPSKTRWCSHINSLPSLLTMYNATSTLQELKSTFNEHVVELLTLTTALDPKEFFKLFDIDKICIPVNKFYPEDFSQKENHLDLKKKISALFGLCKSLVESGKSVMYPLVDRLIRLILTLLVSTTFSKCAFSAMKI
ncbi:hypothetical protein V6Z11_A06G143900 [Gossypium hirsutum]